MNAENARLVRALQDDGRVWVAPGDDRREGRPAALLRELPHDRRRRARTRRRSPSSSGASALARRRPRVSQRAPIDPQHPLNREQCVVHDGARITTHGLNDSHLARHSARPDRRRARAPASDPSPSTSPPPCSVAPPRSVAPPPPVRFDGDDVDDDRAAVGQRLDHDSHRCRHRALGQRDLQAERPRGRPDHLDGRRVDVRDRPVAAFGPVARVRLRDRHRRAHRHELPRDRRTRPRSRCGSRTTTR